MIREDTGEKIDIEHMSGLDKLQSSDKSIQEIISHQMLISELMNATPTSSFEEGEWEDRGAWKQEYVYDEDIQAFSLHRDQSYRENAQSLGENSFPFTFTKEPVNTTGKKPISLLTAALNSPPEGTNITTSKDQPIYTYDQIAGPRGSRYADRDLGGETDITVWTVEQVVSAVFEKCQEENIEAFSRKQATDFEMRLTEDEGVPDMDFPALDFSADVLNIGENEFVLCIAGRSTVVLQIQVRGESKSLEIEFSPISEMDHTFHICLQNKEKGEREVQCSFGSQLSTSHQNSSKSQAGSKLGSNPWQSDSPNRYGYSDHEELFADSPLQNSKQEITIKDTDTGTEFSVDHLDQYVPTTIDPSKLFEMSS